MVLKRINLPGALALTSALFAIVALSISYAQTKAAYSRSTHDRAVWILVGGVTASEAQLRIRVGDSTAAASSSLVLELVFSVNKDSNNDTLSALNETIAIPLLLSSDIVTDSTTLTDDSATDNRTFTNDTTATVSWNEGIYSVQVRALRPETVYHYRVLVASDASTNKTMSTPTTSKLALLTGRFRTPPREGTPYNFTIALAGCAMTGSRHAIFDAIANHGNSTNDSPLQLFLHLGDFHYADIATNDMEARLDAIAATLDVSAPAARLFRSTALAYMWDDHDWLGNDANRDSERQDGARDTALRSYQVAFPHYPLAALATTATDNDAGTTMNDTVHNETTTVAKSNIAPVSPYHAFTIGTIRFVLTDLRSESTATSMWSDAQRTWFFAELSRAADYDFVIWVSTKPWIGDVEPLDDAWYGVPLERSMVSDYIGQTVGNGDLGPQNLLVVAADAHMLAFDNGTNTYYGSITNATTQPSFPILQSGPLDRPGSVKGGPFSDGCTAVLWERNHHYSTIAFEIPPLVDDSGNTNRTAPCLVITGYDTGAGSSQSDTQQVVFTKRLCGKIFAPSSNVRVGTCHASRATTAPRVLFWVALFVVVLTVIGYGMVSSIWQTVLMALLLVLALMFTIAMGLLLTFTMGYEQFDLTTTLSIVLFQAIAMGALVMFWLWSLRRKQSNH
jgi:hypothetical protein